MKIIHNKLVRDNIPEIIQKANKTPNIRILDNDDYLYYLKLKLVEEAKEASNTNNNDELINELADVVEVIEAIIKTTNIAIEDINNAKISKANKNGQFNKKIFLESVDDNNE